MDWIWFKQWTKDILSTHGAEACIFQHGRIGCKMILSQLYVQEISIVRWTYLLAPMTFCLLFHWFSRCLNGVSSTLHESTNRPIKGIKVKNLHHKPTAQPVMFSKDPIIIISFTVDNVHIRCAIVTDNKYAGAGSSTLLTQQRKGTTS